MDYAITSKPALFRGGINVVVKLNFSRDEHAVIQAHRMDEVIVVPAARCPPSCPGGDCQVANRSLTDIIFREFYGRTTSWHCDSAVEAQIFARQLDEGFKRFRELMVANAIVPEEIREDFSLVPFDLSLVPAKLWFEHTYILGESGGGKTQLIQSLFLLHRQRREPPGFVIIDSQNRMLPLIKEKFPTAIHIDPEHNPPHLDLFGLDVSLSDKAGILRLMDTFRYLFEAGGEPLTGRQRTVFERGVALMFFGYPAGLGRKATIADFEDFFEGVRDKRARMLSPNARKAVAALPADERRWYETEYGNFDSTCTEILQRTANIFGQYSPLRPMLTRGEKFDLDKVMDSGGVVLVNTNHGYLQEAGSAFFGRFFIKLIEQHMARRDENSHPAFLVVDEVQEYFDSSLMRRFPDQARKRNIACVFAHQRLAQIRKHGELYEALTGVAIRFATNLNDHDVRDASQIWHAEDAAFMTAQQREPVGEGETPGWANYALYLRGQKRPTSVRVEFFQLERMPKPTAEADYDLHWTKTLHPKVARDGGIFTFHESDGVTQPIKIRAGTTDGMVYRIREYGMRKPDGSFGDLLVKFHVPEMPRHKAEQTASSAETPRGEPHRLDPRRPEDMDTGSAPWPS